MLDPESRLSAMEAEYNRMFQELEATCARKIEALEQLNTKLAADNDRLNGENEALREINKSILKRYLPKK